MTLPYAVDPFAPRRRPTRTVRVGDVALGGEHPIRVQSMTTTDTLDTAGTADQVERLEEIRKKMGLGDGSSLCNLCGTCGKPASEDS